MDERQRMAREIHDTIAQGLTGIVTQLEAAGQASDRPEERQRHIDAAARLARDSLAEARRAVEASRPPQLDGRSLLEAVTAVADEWTAQYGVPVEVSSTGEAVPLHPEIEVALLRIAQEALANVAKHAGATRARLTLTYMGDVVTLDIRDDGVGFVPPTSTTPRGLGFGLERDASAREPRRRHPVDRVGARRGDGHLGPRARDRQSTDWRRRVSPTRILIVDDHPVVRDGLRGMFQGDQDFAVVGEAADGAEAVRLAGDLDPDVILMDLHMPGVDGATAIQQLVERGSRAQVLVLTTYDTDADVVPALEAGATGYLLKDAPRAELVRAVRVGTAG